LASSRSNSRSRSFSIVRVDVQARPYCETKPAALRSANSPMMAAGTIHSGSVPSLKPRSRRKLISHGITGSVAAVTTAPAPAAARPAWLPRT